MKTVSLEESVKARQSAKKLSWVLRGTAWPVHRGTHRGPTRRTRDTELRTLWFSLAPDLQSSWLAQRTPPESLNPAGSVESLEPTSKSPEVSVVAAVLVFRALTYLIQIPFGAITYFLWSTSVAGGDQPPKGRLTRSAMRRVPILMASSERFVT